jgi:GGDEF domain-containing protein
MVADRRGRPLDLDGTIFSPSVSIGPALRHSGQTMSEVIRHADTALYTAKGDGKGKIAHSSRPGGAL